MNGRSRRNSNAAYIVMDFATKPNEPKRPFLLLSFHMSTKDLPNWFWATFEHVDNQGRCDWTGGNDSGRPTPADAAWRSYRLKGSQTEFVTATGRSTLLGNSVTEAGFTNSVSCISCHARAAVAPRATQSPPSPVSPVGLFRSGAADRSCPRIW